MNKFDFTETSIFSLDFNQLVENYDNLEKYIFDALSNTGSIFIKSLGAEIKGDSILLDGNHYSFSVQFDKITRVASICILPIEISRQVELIPDEIAINELGKIKSIFIYCPKIYFKRLQTFATKSAKLIKEEYLKYEQAFLNKYEHNNSKLTNGLYEIINANIQSNHKELILGNYYLSITKLTNIKNENDRYGFSLTTESLHSILPKLKSHQTNLYSPFEFLIELINSEVFDESIEMYKEGIYDGQLKFTEMKKKMTENFKFWTAENLINDNNKSVGFHYFIQERDYLVSCDHPVIYKNDIINILQPIQIELQEQFKINISKYKPKKLKSKINKEDLYNFFRNLFLDFTAKYLAEKTS